MKKVIGGILILASIGVCPLPVLLTGAAFVLLLCGAGLLLS
jgi:hypothetical protein